MSFQKLWLSLVIGLEVILVATYAVSVHLNGGKPFPAFDVNGLRTIPSMLQATQLFLLGALPLWLCVTYQNPQVPPSRLLLAIASLFFLYAAFDETFKLNQIFKQHHLWRLIYITLGISMPILFRRDFVRLWRMHPKASKLMIIGIVVFVTGAFGLEVFRAYVQQPYWYQLFGRWKFYQVDSIRTAIEEFGEMCGESLMLAGMTRMAQKRLEKISS
ncbi:MAG: hypothetical protein KME11_13980 [Timaviella obliquedivisa GSE-PSE-MK23-08B]|jgi:hypothetical protein|nr:hypothetical protein [Timaviella obliquedivisa GSE-PSE-MK23-08B]